MAGRSTMPQEEYDEIRERIRGLDDVTLIHCLLVSQKFVECGQASAPLRRSQTGMLTEVFQRFVPAHVMDQAFAMYDDGETGGADDD